MHCMTANSARLLLGSSVEVVVLGGVDIYVKFVHGVDPYF
jgi:hypothetical protein